MATENFGPSALATPANAITGLRLFVSPLLFLLVLRDGATWLALAVWVVLSVSDGLDGYLARRQGITRSGAFLDPLADKMLVLAAMAALVFTRVFWAAPVLLIAGREITVGIDSHFQVKVGDNLARIAQGLRIALSRSEAVLVCGGLGPTQDDITREAIAEVMNVALERDPAIEARIEEMFRARGREMVDSNRRHA